MGSSLKLLHTFAEQEMEVMRGASPLPPPPSPIIFEGLNWPQQAIYTCVILKVFRFEDRLENVNKGQVL